MKQNLLDKKWLQYTVDLSKNCPPDDAAFAVGAAIVDAHDQLLTDGFSREKNPKIHAEESALQKISSLSVDLSTCTIYCSLEPCNKRLSQQISCVEKIITSGIKRVVFAAVEPPIFVKGHGADRLKAAGIKVILLPEFASQVIAMQSPALQTKWKKSALPTNKY